MCCDILGCAAIRLWDRAGGLQADGGALRYTLVALQDDREIVLEAVKQSKDVLYYALNVLKDDHERFCWRLSSRAFLRCNSPQANFVTEACENTQFT